jgi:hypothetical protein
MAKKTIKLDENSVAGLQLTKNTIEIVASDGNEGANGVHVNEDGVHISGKVSIHTTPSQIRVGGFWVQNSPWRQMLPSNAAFPNPVLQMNTSFQGIEKMVQSVAWFASLLI